MHSFLDRFEFEKVFVMLGARSMTGPQGKTQTPASERVLEAMGDAVFTVEGAGGIVFENRAAAHLFGSIEPARSMPLGVDFAVRLEQRLELLDEQDQRLARDAFPSARALATGRDAESIVAPRDRSSGEERWYSARASPVHDEAGAVEYVVTALSDATDRQRAVADARVSQQWFSTTLRSIGDAVIATDHEGHITFMNPVAEELTGWRSDEARGVPLKAVFHIVNEQSRLEVESPVTKVLREGVVVGLANLTIRIRRDGTELAIDDSGAPIRDPSGRLVGVVLVFRDVTAKRREEERRLFLGEASPILASSLDYATTMRTIADLAVPRVADWCLVQVRNDDGTIAPLAYAHLNAAKAKWLFEIGRKYPTDPAGARRGRRPPYGQARAAREG